MLGDASTLFDDFRTDRLEGEGNAGSFFSEDQYPWASVESLQQYEEEYDNGFPYPSQTTQTTQVSYREPQIQKDNTFVFILLGITAFLLWKYLGDDK